MNDLHRLSKVQSVQQDTQECCAAHRIDSLDDLSKQATDVLQRLGAIPLTRVLDQRDEMILAGKDMHGDKRALWLRIMKNRMQHGGKAGHSGKGKAAGRNAGKTAPNGGKLMGPDQRKLRLHPVEIVGETVEAETPGSQYDYPNHIIFHFTH